MAFRIQSPVYYSKLQADSPPLPIKLIDKSQFMDLSVSQGICLKLQSSWGFVSKFTFPKLSLKSRPVLNSIFSCMQYLVIKFVVSGAPFCALLLVWAYHRSLATFTWVVKNNKSNRFFGTIYFWKRNAPAHLPFQIALTPVKIKEFLKLLY